jgi:hypothetical protein
VCWRYARIGRCPKRAGYSWNNFEIYAGLGAGLGFFSASPKEKRVAALEPPNDAVILRLFYQQRVYLGLGHSVSTCELAHRYDFRTRPGQAQQLARNQMIMKDYVRPAYQLMTLEGDKSCSARTGADKIDFSL